MGQEIPSVGNGREGYGCLVSILFGGHSSGRVIFRYLVIKQFVPKWVGRGKKVCNMGDTWYSINQSVKKLITISIQPNSQQKIG